MTDVPAAEADETVDLPMVAEEATSATVSAFSRQATQAPRRRAVFGALAVVVVAVAAVVMWWPRAVVSEIDLVALPSVTPGGAAQPSIVVRLETTPLGAKVMVDGQLKGVTPTSVTIERGSELVLLELEHDGFERWSQRVTPDANQRFVVTLKPVQRSLPPPKPSASVDPGYIKL
jgi:hypothetical protein